MLLNFLPLVEPHDVKVKARGYIIIREKRSKWKSLKGGSDSVFLRVHLFLDGRSCPNINFFTSEVNLKEWRAIHPDVDGEIIGLDEAFEYAKRMLQEHIH